MLFIVDIQSRLLSQLESLKFSVYEFLISFLFYDEPLKYVEVKCSSSSALCYILTRFSTTATTSGLQWYLVLLGDAAAGARTKAKAKDVIPKELYFYESAPGSIVQDCYEICDRANLQEYRVHLQYAPAESRNFPNRPPGRLA